MEKACKCKPMCLGTSYCESSYATVVMGKDEKGKPCWYIQKNPNGSECIWEKIIAKK